MGEGFVWHMQIQVQGEDAWEMGNSRSCYAWVIAYSYTFFTHLLRDDGRAYTLCAPRPEYLSPEALLGSKEGEGQGSSVDVWALGILISGMLTGGGDTPFSGEGGEVEEGDKERNYGSQPVWL